MQLTFRDYCESQHHRENFSRTYNFQIWLGWYVCAAEWREALGD